MTIYERLCYYDKRNPDNFLEGFDKDYINPPNCYCDNCFYDRTKLAENILDIREMLIKGALTNMSCSSAIVELDKIIT